MKPKLKKKITVLILIFFFLLPLTSLAFEVRSPLQYEDFNQLIDAVINFLFYLAVVTAPLLIIIGGFYLVASGGDSEKIKTGKRMIMYSLIGLVIAFLAKGFVAFIMDAMKIAE